MKSYENQYYDDVRLNFIESLESLQNDKELKKRRKNNKRKANKKKVSCSPHG